MSKKMYEKMNEIIQKLNECVKTWYINYLPEYKSHFTPCCTKDEIKNILDCYFIAINIFDNKKDDNINEDIIKALIVYYYMLMVFENYIYHYIDEKYLKIVDEQYSEDKNKKIFIDNIDNIYEYYICKDNDSENIEIYDPFSKKKYYVSKNRKNNKYIYKDSNCKQKTIIEDHMNCLEHILDTEESKKYYKELFLSDKEEVSYIRQKFLNMNKKNFKGGKNTKKYKKKNKKTKKNKIYKKIK
jgi:hypothetical protein